MLTSHRPQTGGTPRPAIKPVSQVMLRLERDEPNVFEAVQQQVLSWVSLKAGKALPSEAWEGGTFELIEIGAQRVAAARLNQPPYWAARVDDACKEVAGRTWITEVGIKLAPEGGVLFGCRLIVSARGENPPFRPTVPGFVRKVIQAGTAYLDGHAISAEPPVVSSQRDVDRLYDLMISKFRRTDICAFSFADDDQKFASEVASAAYVHRHTVGAARVFMLTPSASNMLTELVGKEFSVYNRAVRTYRPGFDKDVDSPWRHPVAPAYRITSWRGDGIEGPRAFEDFLVRSAIAQTVASDLDEILIPFSEARRAATAEDIAHAVEKGASKDELVRLYEEENDKLQSALEEEKAVHAGLLADLDDERRRADEAKGDVFRLKYRIQALECQLRSGAAAHTVLPGSLGELEDWANKHLSGSVSITRRALRGAKHSDFEDQRSFIIPC